MHSQPTYNFHHSTKFINKAGKQFCFFDIYSLNAEANIKPTYQAMITFFTIHNDVDYQDVLRYRHMVESEFLVALQTGEAMTDNIDLADNIIICQAEDVIKVLQAFDKMLADDSFIQLNAIDIRVFLQQAKYLYFSQTHAVSPNFIKAMDGVTQAILQQQPQNITVESMIITQAVSPNYGLEEYQYITDFFDNLDDTGTIDKWYAINMEEATPFWQQGETGIWLGVFFLFND